MVSTKRNDEERSVTPSTEKKKRRTSLEPAELPTLAEQRQRAKDWAEKQKLDKAAEVATETLNENKPEKKKREVKTAKSTSVVEEPSELVTTKSSRRLNKDSEPEENFVEVPVKAVRRLKKETAEEVVETVKISSRGRPKRESLSLLQSHVSEEIPVTKKVKSSKRVKEDVVVEDETPLNVTNSFPEDSPFRSATTVSNPSTATKLTTPYKNDTSPMRQIDSAPTPEGSPTPVKRGRPARTPSKSVEQPTSHSPFLPSIHTSDVVVDEETASSIQNSPVLRPRLVENNVDTTESEASEATCCSGNAHSVLRYVFVALVLSAWAFALYMDKTVGGLALAGFAVLFALKRVACGLCAERPQGVPHAESSDYYLTSATSRQQLKSD